MSSIFPFREKKIVIMIAVVSSLLVSHVERNYHFGLRFSRRRHVMCLEHVLWTGGGIRCRICVRVTSKGFLEKKRDKFHLLLEKREKVNPLVSRSSLEDTHLGKRSTITMNDVSWTAIRDLLREWLQFARKEIIAMTDSLLPFAWWWRWCTLLAEEGWRRRWEDDVEHHSMAIQVMWLLFLSSLVRYPTSRQELTYNSLTGLLMLTGLFSLLRLRKRLTCVKERQVKSLSSQRERQNWKMTEK